MRSAGELAPPAVQQHAVGATDAVSARPLRVCHLIGSLRYGGAERQVVNLLNHLPMTERYVLLLDPNGRGELRDALDPSVEVGTVPFRLRHGLPAVRHLAATLRQWRIDILHSHMFWPNLLGTVAARLAGVPVVLTSEHGKNLWKSRWHRWVERHVITPGADLRLCASEDILRLRAEVDRIPTAKLAYLPNGTELPRLEPRRLGAAPVIGTVGRMVPAKDFGSLIAAAALLRERGLEFRLCLVGDGPLRPDLKQAVSMRGLDAVVEFAGFQSDVSAWLRRFDLFVLPSVQEGQPLALLEAMAHGLAVVATRVGGIPRTVRDGEEALLVQPSDPAALADALQRLLTDPQRRAELGRAARRRVEAEFSIDAVAARYQAIYRELWDAKHETHA